MMLSLLDVMAMLEIERLLTRSTGRGSSVGSVSASNESGPGSGTFFGLFKSKLSVTGERMDTKYW